MARFLCLFECFENNQRKSNVARGGKRDGAGRKSGSATERTRDIADKATKDGVTPLEVMLEAMMAHHKAGSLDDAARIAKDAAPYMHPRLQAIEHGGKDGTPLFPVLNVTIGGGKN